MVDSLVTLYVWFTLIRHGYQIFMLTTFSAKTLFAILSIIEVEAQRIAIKYGLPGIQLYMVYIFS